MANLTRFLTAMDALSLKERLLLTSALSLVMTFLVNRWVLQPMDKDRTQLINAIASKREATAGLERQEQILVANASQDPDAGNRALLQDLRDQLAATQRHFARTADHLIAPNKVPELLRSVLEKSKGLKLVRLESLGVEPLVLEAKNAIAIPGTTTPAENDASPYRHAVRIEIEGSYLDLLNYLRAVEALPWSLYWQSAELRVHDHPNAVLSVVVNTLSLSKTWIGT